MGAERLSYMCSQYHQWFIDMGYPELDVMEKNDGCWYIIQYYNRPVIPALTRWQVVLGPMRNVEISRGFIQKYVNDLDMHKRGFWEREERKTQEVEQEQTRENERRIEYANKAHEAITRNPDLMERIAENGLSEMDVPSIARHVPRSEVVKSTLKGEKVNASSSESGTKDGTTGDAGLCGASQPAN